MIKGAIDLFYGDDSINEEEKWLLLLLLLAGFGSFGMNLIGVGDGRSKRAGDLDGESNGNDWMRRSGSFPSKQKE